MSDRVDRPATESERTVLRQLQAHAPGFGRRFKEGAESAFVMWCSMSLVLVLAWLAIAWLGRRFLGVDYGLHSDAAPWVLSIALPVIAVFAVVSTARWQRRSMRAGALLRADIDNGRVTEEHHVFDAAKRFQEPEHGGLIYFLRTPPGRAFAFYDRQSQDLGAGGGDPLASTLAPRTRLMLVRAPATGHVISSVFSGSLLDAGQPIDLTARPQDWPEPERWCDISWDDLEGRLSPP